MNKKNILNIFILSFLIFVLSIKTLYAENIFEITAKKVLYKDNNKLIIAEGNAIAKNNDGKEISSDKIIYYKNKNLIKTFGNSKYFDGKNTLEAQNFIYDLNIKSVEAVKNVILLDKDNNKFFFNRFKYFEKTQIGKGTESRININDGSFVSSSQIETNLKKGKTVFKNANYTTCNNKYINDKYCPSWNMNSKETIHDKNKKTLTHKNTILKIRNIPVLYVPYITHPDPTVKRKSGFLAPSFKTINTLGKTLNIPYFWAISKDQDLTIKPVIYFDQHHALQTSYRKVFKNSFLQIENGYTKGYKKFDDNNKTSGSRNFFFLDYQKKNINNLNSNIDIDLKIQRISQENYVRVNKINTSLFKEDINNLENSFKISKFNNSSKLDIKFAIFENLSSNDTEKYTYYLPNGVYSKNFNNNKYNLNINSYFEGTKFLKNQKQGKIRNLISFSSKNYVHRNSGLSTVFKNNFYNNNIYNKNVDNLKEKLNVDSYITTAIENSFPLAKFSEKYQQTLIPKIFTKFTSGKMQDTSTENKKFFYSDIYSMNRTNNLDKPETGLNLGYGIDYTLLKKNVENINRYHKFSSGIGQVISDVNRKQMSQYSSLTNKSSDFAGFAKFEFFGDKDLTKNNNKNINELNFFQKNNLTINYDFNLDTNLSKLNKSNLETQFSFSKIYSKFNFIEENMHVGNERYATIDFKTRIKENYFFSVGGKRNLKNNTSEYHNISFSFENDCLQSYLALNKDFYTDKDLKPSKTLIFGIVIKPFSDSFGPDLSDFIN